MGTLIKASKLARAEVVLAIVQTLLQDDDPDFHVSVFRNGSISGFHLSSSATSCQVNVAGSHTSDGYVVALGTPEEFDPESFAALDSSARVDFNHDQPYQAAQYVLDCLRPRVSP